MKKHNVDTDKPTPYKGLMPYEEGDAAFFFGRQKYQKIIIDNLLASRLTVLYGTSGVGKTSVLQAGVARHLRDLARKNLEELGINLMRPWREAIRDYITKEFPDYIATESEERMRESEATG